MPRYYSQRGEDFILWALFNPAGPPGYFVEVGALDGTRFSNTYSFERAGWRGLCIEAHPDYIPLLREKRPGSQIVFAAAGDHNGQITFYTNARGSLSTLDPTQEKHFKEKYGAYFTGFKPVDVRMVTLDTALEETIAPAPIDILSVDIEGAELLALKGLNLTKYSPRVMVIEATSNEEDSELTTYLETQGYIKARRHFSNVFFCRDWADANTLATMDVQCEVIHTPHMLDKNRWPELFLVNNERMTPRTGLYHNIRRLFL